MLGDLFGGGEPRSRCELRPPPTRPSVACRGLRAPGMGEELIALQSGLLQKRTTTVQKRLGNLLLSVAK